MKRFDYNKQEGGQLRGVHFTSKVAGTPNPQSIPDTKKEEKKIELNDSQKEAFEALKKFCSHPLSKVFILTGYAGTGKTTLLKTFIDWLVDKKGATNEAEKKYSNFEEPYIAYDEGEEISGQSQSADSIKFIPLASTGRAAKILRDKIGQECKTIHSCIYKYTGFNRDIEKEVDGNKEIDDQNDLYLLFKETTVESEGITIYVIDESSMIGDFTVSNPTQAKFGDGKTLTNLLQHDPNGKFVFVGDNCQLPPVGSDSSSQDSSPALSKTYLEQHFHYSVQEWSLTEIVRQEKGNDLIEAAAEVRKMCVDPPQLRPTSYNIRWAKLPLRGYEHIKLVNSQKELINEYIEEIQRHGYNSATLITRTNKDCNELAKALRYQLGFVSPTLSVGELLLVTQNSITGLVNGDLVRVKAIGSRQHKAVLTFLNVELEEISTGKLYHTMLIEDLLYSNTTNLDQETQKELFIDFFKRERSKGINQEDEQFDVDLINDPFLNALRSVYGYALTCHKAQGGEWDKVYLDFPSWLSKNPNKSLYQWLYTAMTRASDTLYMTDGFYIEGYSQPSTYLPYRTTNRY